MKSTDYLILSLTMMITARVNQWLYHANWSEFQVLQAYWHIWIIGLVLLFVALYKGRNEINV